MKDSYFTNSLSGFLTMQIRRISEIAFFLSRKFISSADM